MLRSPSFPEEQLEKERLRVLTSLKEDEEDALSVALKAFSALVYGNHPAGRNIEGDASTVRAITRQDLLDFHAKLVPAAEHHPRRGGRLQGSGVREKPGGAFGDWQRGAAPAAVSLPPLQRQTDRRTRRLPMDRDQMQILLGHLGIRRTDPDYMPLQVMDSILGQSAGFTARIPYQLRDIQGLAYTVEASITSSAGVEPGLFRAYIGTEAKNENAAVMGLFAEFAASAMSPLSQVSSRGARLSANNYVFGFETQDQLAGYLQAVIRYGLGYDYRRMYVRDVRSVTAGQVLAAAKRHLDPFHYSLVVVGKTQASGKDAK